MKPKHFFFSILLLAVVASCVNRTGKSVSHTRNLVDTIGFAHLDWQMDSIIGRLGFEAPSSPEGFRLAICPHDDYTYAGPLYPRIFSNLHAKTVILFGVAHKAAALGVENQLVFGTFDQWKGPFGLIPVSSVREQILKRLDTDVYQVNDSLQQIEHSIEALLPFMQYYRRDVEIVPILVPAMPYERMVEIAEKFAGVLDKIFTDKQWDWGKDVSLAISNDAVHYGDEDWGGRNFARYGSDSAGYQLAVGHEHEILDSCLLGELTPERIKRFTEYTVEADNFRTYKWTWCGRYAVPFGLLTGYFLGEDLKADPLNGDLKGYLTSIDHDTIPVSDLGMGRTAPAKLGHWVGYAAVEYR